MVGEYHMAIRYSTAREYHMAIHYSTAIHVRYSTGNNVWPWNNVWPYGAPQHREYCIAVERNFPMDRREFLFPGERNFPVEAK